MHIHSLPTFDSQSYLSKKHLFWKVRGSIAGCDGVTCNPSTLIGQKEDCRPVWAA
jgi:hypothetical protein